MRFVVSALSASLAIAGVVACTETVYVPTQPATADAGPSSDGGTETRPSTSASKDAGAKPTPDAGSMASKPTTCSAAAQCLGDCEGQESSCTDKCYGALPDDELRELQAISLCIADSGCTDDACVAEVCAAEIEACMTE